MARFFVSIRKTVECLCQPLDREGYRAIARHFVIGLIVTVAMFSIAVPKWKFVLVVTVCTLPLMLLSSLWHVQKHPEARRPLDVPWSAVVIGSLVLAGLVFKLEPVIPSVAVRFVVAVLANIVLLYAGAYLLTRLRTR